MNEKKPLPPFTSRMGKWETAAALLYLPIHIALLPTLVSVLLGDGINRAQLNFICYATAMLYMLVFEGRFLRRDFDPLCDHWRRILLEILISYGMMMAFNLLLNGTITLVQYLVSQQQEFDFALGNPNNSAVIGMSEEGFGTVSALAIFLAPIVEELMFRGGVFGLLRRYHRGLAYAVSILLFSVYHVWGYASSDPWLWLYLLQYIPVSFLLCRCYERSNSIWGSIFLHMLINFLSIQALTLLQELL